MFVTVRGARRPRRRGEAPDESNAIFAARSSRDRPTSAAQTGPLFDHLWGTVVIFVCFIVVTRREDRRFPNTAPGGREGRPHHARCWRWSESGCGGDTRGRRGAHEPTKGIKRHWARMVREIVTEQRRDQIAVHNAEEWPISDSWNLTKHPITADYGDEIITDRRTGAAMVKDVAGEDGGG